MAFSRKRALAGRIGGLRLAATHDPQQYPARARKKFLERFENEVDPDRLLPEKERVRRATAARKAYFAQLALKSAEARRGRATKRSGRQS